MPSQGQLTDDERFGIQILTGLMCEEGWYDTETGIRWKSALKEPLSRNLAEERAYDIIVGTYYSDSDKIKAARARHYNKKLGFEKCLQLAFNFHDSFTVDDVKRFIEIFQETSWKQLSGAKFIVEFFSYKKVDDGDDWVPTEELKWNPHIHVWLPYTSPAALRQLAKRKFASDKINVWVGPGNKNLKNYVLGIKQDSKCKLLAADREFREKNGIPHIFEF